MSKSKFASLFLLLFASGFCAPLLYKLNSLYEAYQATHPSAPNWGSLQAGDEFILDVVLQNTTDTLQMAVEREQIRVDRWRTDNLFLAQHIPLPQQVGTAKGTSFQITEMSDTLLKDAILRWPDTTYLWSKQQPFVFRTQRVGWHTDSVQVVRLAVLPGPHNSSLLGDTLSCDTLAQVPTHWLRDEYQNLGEYSRHCYPSSPNRYTERLLAGMPMVAHFRVLDPATTSVACTNIVSFNDSSYLWSRHLRQEFGHGAFIMWFVLAIFFLAGSLFVRLAMRQLMGLPTEE